ncbi:MAG: hypothetical protein IJ646_08335 [Clostridia bacterium]|nr:hypothetical protein [Clostridia bacterium]
MKNEDKWKKKLPFFWKIIFSGTKTPAKRMYQSCPLENDKMFSRGLFVCSGGLWDVYSSKLADLSLRRLSRAVCSKAAWLAG